MNATLYLSRLSFSYEDGSLIEDICSRIKNLFETHRHIKDHAAKFPETKDVILKCNDIYDIDILKKLWGCEFTDLYTNSCKMIPPDVRMAFLKLIDRSDKTDETEIEIISNILCNDENNLKGFLCIDKNIFTGMNPIYLISNTNEWYLFHRDHLANYWRSEEYFYVELIKYYNDIYFHPRVETCLKSLDDGGLRFFSRTIIFNLTQLNDNFKIYYIPSDWKKSLLLFSSACHVEVTLDRKRSRKHLFTFTFENSEGITENVCCEPHMKLSSSDSPSDSGWHFNRIYFHPGIANIEKGKILVGHIGKHL